MGLRLPSVELVACVLRLYGVELAQLAPNSPVKLRVFEWTMRSAETRGEVRLFAYLHDSWCQSNPKKSIDEIMNFGNVNF